MERGGPAGLVGPNGEQVALPAALSELLAFVLESVQRQQAILVMPEHPALTTNQAAALLGVSRPSLVGLLDLGKIPHSRTGTHRRSLLADLRAYQVARAQPRRRALDDLTVADEVRRTQGGRLGYPDVRRLVPPTAAGPVACFKSPCNKDRIGGGGLVNVCARQYTRAMSGRDKVERKARRNPGSLRIDEVVRLAETEGCTVTRTTGGRYVVSHTRLTYTVGLAEPHGGEPLVKLVYVRKLLSALDELRDKSADPEE